MVCNSLCNCGRFSFAVFGDVLYFQSWENDQVDNMIDDINNDKNVRFTFGVGDYSSESWKTKAEIDAKKIALFDKFKNPVITTLGDNDWSEPTGTYIPGTNLTQLEALNYMRDTWFNTGFSMGQLQTTIERQAGPTGTAGSTGTYGPTGTFYPENQRFVYGGIVFASFHTVGGADDKITRSSSIPSTSDRDAEWTARRQANLDWINGTFDLAIAQNLKGIVFFTHASHWQRDVGAPTPLFRGNPYGFKNTPANSPNISNYEAYYRTIQDRCLTFGDVTLENIIWNDGVNPPVLQPRPVGGKQVLLIYGDDHRTTIDRPMVYPFRGFTRAGVTNTAYSPGFTGSVAGTTLTVSGISSSDRILTGMGLTGPGFVGTPTVTRQITIDPLETGGAGLKGTYLISTSQTVPLGRLAGITQNWEQRYGWDMPNYTEIQVPGSPRTGWMKINVNTLDPKLFSYQLGPTPRTL